MTSLNLCCLTVKLGENVNTYLDNMLCGFIGIMHVPSLGQCLGQNESATGSSCRTSSSLTCTTNHFLKAYPSFKPSLSPTFSMSLYKIDLSYLFRLQRIFTCSILSYMEAEKLYGLEDTTHPLHIPYFRAFLPLQQALNHSREKSICKRVYWGISFFFKM